MRPICTYLICATPRSGSTLLCEALTNTGMAGYPKEYFEALKATALPRRPKEYFTTLSNPDVTHLLGDYSRLDHASASQTVRAMSTYAHYLAHVLEEGTTSNGVFGAKVMWGYFGDFLGNLREIPAYKEMPVPDLPATVFPNLQYIKVVRLNTISQAVSLWRAIQTWTWRVDEATSAAHGIGHEKRALQFHFEAIDHLVQQIEEHNRAWQQFFDAACIRPYTVVYEDLVANYEATALHLLQYLGISFPENLVFAERLMKQQADALSKEWVGRYQTLKQDQARMG